MARRLGPSLELLLPALLLLTGCGTAAPEPVPPSSPTSTPIPAAGLTPTLRPVTDPTPTAVSTPTPTSAPAIAGVACNLINTPFDAMVTGAALFTGLKAEFRYSGSDEHFLTTFSDPEGVLVGKDEHIFKDDTFYKRESAPGSPEVYGEWRVQPNVRQLFTRPICLDPSSVEEAASSSSGEPHYVSERFLSEQEGAVRDEYWADSAGWPIRRRRTFFPPGYDGSSNAEIRVVEYTYSGYGELNIIEAPCARAMPDEADNPDLMRDCIYLLTAKDYLGDAEDLNWSLDTPITSWEGVTMEGTPQRITRLLLPSKNLTGRIYFNLWRMSALTHLDLSHNTLTGEIPGGFAQLSDLQEIRLSGNSLTGCIRPALRDVVTNDLASLNLPDC